MEKLMEILSHHFSTAAERIPSAKVAADAAMLKESQDGSCNPTIGGQQPYFIRVLMIEDDVELRDLNAMAMMTHGFRVDTAGNGEAGWKALCHSRYDLVITDHDMPELTGLDLIKRMRSVSFDLPCILFSGQLPGSEDALTKVIQPGVALHKPLSPCQLIAETKALLVAQMDCALNEQRTSSA
jgi:DNA-binding response OmpR family regulator